MGRGCERDPEIVRVVGEMVEARGLAAKSGSAYIVAADHFCKFVGGFDAMLSATREDVDAWVEHMRETGVRPKSMSSFRSQASAVLSFLELTDCIVRNPFRGTLRACGREDYNEPISPDEIRAVLARAEEVAANPGSSEVNVRLALVAMLHVRHCIPFSAMARISRGDYVEQGCRGVIRWRFGKSLEVNYTELAPSTRRCLDRYLAMRGVLYDCDPLIARVHNPERGFPNEDSLRRSCSDFYTSAGVRTEGRSVKLAAVRLAAESGASAGEIQSLASNIGSAMAFQASKESAQAPSAELWERVHAETGRRAPKAIGKARARELRRALATCGEAGEVGFVVDFDGSLRLCPVSELAKVALARR